MATNYIQAKIKKEKLIKRFNKIESILNIFKTYTVKENWLAKTKHNKSSYLNKRRLDCTVTKADNTASKNQYDNVDNLEHGLNGARARYNAWELTPERLKKKKKNLSSPNIWHDAFNAI